MPNLTNKVVVFGATGKIGQLVLKELLRSKIKPTAVVRTQEQEKSISSISSEISLVKFALDNSSVKDIKDIIKGHDAIVFTAGSAGKNLLQVDLDGAVKTFEAARDANVRRLVLVSALHADDRDFIAKSPIQNYYIAKHYADRILVDEFQKDLDFTILKPSLLTDNDGTGKISIIGRNQGSESSIDRIDVARVIVLILNNPKTFGKSYNIIQGEDSLDDPSIY